MLYREGQSRAKVLSNMIKQKRKEKAVSEGRVLYSGDSIVRSQEKCFDKIWCFQLSQATF